MQVYPEQARVSAAANADDGQSSKLGQKTTPPYQLLSRQAPPSGYDPYVVVLPGQYAEHSDRVAAQPQNVYAPWPGGQPQGQNNQSIQQNFVGQAPMPVVVSQQVEMLRTPQSYLFWSIFNFLCCCWPLGLAAIVYSTKVRSAQNIEEAKSHSLTARNLNISATVTAPLLVVLVVGLVVGGRISYGGAGASYYTPKYYYSYLETYSYTAYAADYSYYSYYSYYYYYRYYYSYSYTVYAYRYALGSSYY